MPLPTFMNLFGAYSAADDPDADHAYYTANESEVERETSRQAAATSRRGRAAQSGAEAATHSRPGFLGADQADDEEGD
jgi:hypothetical protein